MSNLKTYFKNFVSVCKKGFAYVRAISVLVKATYQRMVGDGIYNVSFIKVGRKWYCEVPGFPKVLFEHTLMVGGAAKLLDSIDKTDKEVIIAIAGKDATAEELQAVHEYASKNYPMLEFYEVDGGQDIYSFIFAVE